MDLVQNFFAPVLYDLSLSIGQKWIVDGNGIGMIAKSTHTFAICNTSFQGQERTTTVVEHQEHQAIKGNLYSEENVVDKSYTLQILSADQAQLKEFFAPVLYDLSLSLYWTEMDC